MRRFDVDVDKTQERSYGMDNDGTIDDGASAGWLAECCPNLLDMIT